MVIGLERLVDGGHVTVGLLSVDGMPICWSLEDQGQPGGKIPGETRIPAGRYRIRGRIDGRTHARLARRFGGEHRGVLQLVGAPGFAGIQIHPGADDEDTARGILPGMSVDQKRPRGAQLAPNLTSEQVAFLREFDENDRQEAEDIANGTAVWVSKHFQDKMNSSVLDGPLIPGDPGYSPDPTN